MKTLTQKIITHLSLQNQTVSFAESCTGGRIASEFTAISGASSVLNGSCVTYSNQIKSLWLGVGEDTLINFGAVSAECVEEMLIGIQKMASSHYAIAVSGIAGPTGGTDLKPVGTVYIGILTPTNTQIERYSLEGTRVEIQTQATKKAIENLAKSLNL
jgi:nicotinamide-nucleotide amidase